jgi:hypothetical protein
LLHHLPSPCDTQNTTIHHPPPRRPCRRIRGTQQRTYDNDVTTYTTMAQASETCTTRAETHWVSPYYQHPMCFRLFRNLCVRVAQRRRLYPSRVDTILLAPRSASAMYTYIFPERAPLEMTYDVPFVCDPRQRGTSPFRSSFALCTYGLRGAKHTTQRRSNSVIPNSSHVMRNALHGPAIPCIGINTGGRRGCSSPAFLPTCSGTLNRQMLPVRRPPLSRSECRRPVSESCARL